MEFCNYKDCISLHCSQSNEFKIKLHDHFQKVCAHPLMWFGTRESIVSVLKTLLYLNGKDGSKLFTLFPKNGNIVLTLGDMLDDEFAQKAIDMARQLWADNG